MSPAAGKTPTLLGASAVMAAGTIFSRLSGFVRSALLVAALGAGLHADVFNLANTLPNMLYILLAGGIFNAVLVPQLVRSMKNDADGGEAYTQRIVTLAALFLGTVSVLLVLLAPIVLKLYLADSWYSPEHEAQLQSLITFARWCLPQVFFYGMFVLVGQVLNSREVFGPMMWAPIMNNLISVGVLVAYLVIFGAARHETLTGAFTPGQELLLGLGSTAGIACQFAVLLPYLKRAGFSWRPRFDFAHAGLGHTLRLGWWTVLFVLVNQVAYLVVVKLASDGTLQAADGTGYTIYSNAFLIAMVPHSIITVSLATAMMPRLAASAADGELAEVGRRVVGVLRMAWVVVLLFAAVLPAVAPDVARVIWGINPDAGDPAVFVPSLSLFGLGLVFFTGHYLMLRGFYALEDTRTVFFIQCVIAAVNIVAALALVSATNAAFTSPALVMAYTAAYAVGLAVSMTVLNRRLQGGLDLHRLAGFVVRMLPVVAAAGLVAWGVTALLAPLTAHSGELGDYLLAFVRGTLAGGSGLLVAVLLARLLKVDEVLDLFAGVRARLGR